MGVFAAFLSLLYAAIIVVKTLILGLDVPGYASLITVVLFMGGIQLISLGIIGEYIARVFLETKQRPIYTIDDARSFRVADLNRTFETEWSAASLAG